MEGDGLGLDFAFLDVDLVASQDDGNLLADTNEVACLVSNRRVFLE